jgi:hypothetical protein
VINYMRFPPALATADVGSTSHVVIPHRLRSTSFSTHEPSPIVLNLCPLETGELFVEAIWPAPNLPADVVRDFVADFCRNVGALARVRP